MRRKTLFRHNVAPIDFKGVQPSLSGSKISAPFHRETERASSSQQGGGKGFAIACPEGGVARASGRPWTGMLTPSESRRRSRRLCMAESLDIRRPQVFPRMTVRQLNSLGGRFQSVSLVFHVSHGLVPARFREALHR